MLSMWSSPTFCCLVKGYTCSLILTCTLRYSIINFCRMKFTQCHLTIEAASVTVITLHKIRVNVEAQILLSGKSLTQQRS